VGCHDTYIFRPPLPSRLTETDVIDFRVGAVWGSENLFLYELKHSGLTIYNPCYDVKVYHNHCSNKRPWTHDSSRINTEKSFTKGPDFIPKELKKLEDHEWDWVVVVVGLALVTICGVGFIFWCCRKGEDDPQQIKDTKTQHFPSQKLYIMYKNKNNLE